ncbi:AI-2E family transporter [Sanguibacter inulinus]|jgi:predicted PurR-regulated permease PerM|uniref:AI-2E family transporter n=1 Tax=Sanguibacter inulinus TaxID=60922 RepID=A0A853ETH6_9MICO|nr:AI-2E family transporter [Sanguibacter inulinus]MBF0721909.1 AI-2E family transporter [Sanguibacter inulinus]NYS93054.1 AI-2E family transporter [Sanguibacter inulinus]
MNLSPAAPAAPPASYYSRRPPRWLGRALLSGVVTVFAAIFVWRALGSLTSLIVNLIIALFLALAMEPMILWLVKHGWKRGAATATVLFSLLAAAAAVIALFGRMFLEQAGDLIRSLPSTYDSVTLWAEKQFDVVIPEMEDLQAQLLQDYGNEVASRALAIGTSVIGGLFAFATILLVSYYLAAAGPKFRASICGWLRPKNQTEVLRLWEITQIKISDYINSRVVLAAIASFFTGVFLTIIDIPYALPLALFTGVVSQFVPTIGTYIGGALPIVFALTGGSWQKAVMVLGFIILYQQVENMWLSPKISARALQMNPAVSFVVVLAFGAVFGALGAFLSLPVAATIQAVATTYLRRHELVDSHMLHDPAPGDSDGGEEESSDGAAEADESTAAAARATAHDSAADGRAQSEPPLPDRGTDGTRD